MDNLSDLPDLDENFYKVFHGLNFSESEQNEIFLQMINADKIESVSTKILAYIFDSHNAHGLGNIPLQALFNLLGIKQKAPKFSTTKEEVTCFHTKKVEKKGRIDLVIKASPYLFVIENKIRHKLDNPLDTYRKWIEKNYATDKFSQKYYIVLGINKPKENLKDFKFISHHSLVSKILEIKEDKEIIGTTYLSPFINDYFRAMINMKTTLSNEETQILNFCIENFKKLDQLQDFKEKIAKVFESNIINIIQEIKVFSDCKVYKDITESWQNLGAYSDSKHIFVKNWAFRIQIHYCLESISFYLTPFSKIHKKPLKQENFNDFLKYLRSLDVKFTEIASSDEFYVELLRFEPMEDNKKVINKINDVIAKLQ